MSQQPPPPQGMGPPQGPIGTTYLVTPGGVLADGVEVLERPKPATHERIRPGAAPPVRQVAHLGETRSLFWQNVVREMLCAFAVQAQQDPSITDGRVSVITRLGTRVPLSAVYPLFPCSIPDPRERDLCMAVQCTVFELHTPSGEILLLPLGEIASVHVVSDQLLRHIQNAASEAQREAAGDMEPFGFAAYTSLARQSREEDAAQEQPGD